MVGGHEGDAAIGLPLAAEFGDADGFAEEAFHGGGAEGDDDAGADEIDLLMEPGAADSHLIGRGLAVAGGLAGGVRAAFQNIGDVEVVARAAGGLDDFGEQLAGAAHEGLAAFIFIGPRSFPDEEEFAVDIAHAEDDVFARGGEVRAFDAGEGAFAQGGKGGGFFARRQRGRGGVFGENRGDCGRDRRGGNANG